MTSEAPRPSTAAEPLRGESGRGAGTRRFGFTRRQHAYALAIFAGVTMVFFAPLVRGDTFSDVAGRQQQVYPWAGIPQGAAAPVLHFDQADSSYPWQVFENRTLRDRQFPFWNPYSFGGEPFLANGQSGVLYPPRLALSLVASPARVHDILLATHLFLAGVAMFLLLGVARLSFPAALVGGLAWMLNSFALSWQALEHYTAIEVWLPAGVLVAHLVVQRTSWVTTTGLALVLGLLYTGGNVLFVELAVLTIVAYGVALASSGERRPRRLAAIGGRLIAALIACAGLGAVVILPSLAVAAESARASLSYTQLDRYALPWSALRNILVTPTLAGHDPYHHALFAGTAVGFLAILGLRRADVLARFAAALGVVAILFMVHTPVTFVIDHLLPGFDNFKPLARAAFLLQFGLAILAGYGLEVVRGWLAAPSARRRLQLQLGGAAMGGLLIDRVLIHAFGRVPRFEAVFSLALAMVLAGALAFTLVSRRTTLVPWLSHRLSRRLGRTSLALGLLTAVVAGSIVGQEWLWARKVMHHQPDASRSLYPQTPLIRTLAASSPTRFLPTYPAFRGSTAMIAALPSAGGYESLLPKRIADFWRVIGGSVPPATLASRPLIFAYHPAFDLSRLQPDLLARAGVDTVVSPPPEAGEHVPAALDLRYSARDGRIFSVPDALPRTYVVGGCDEVGSPIAALERFVSPGFTPGSAVILERSSLHQHRLSCAGQPPGRAGVARVAHESVNSLTVDVAANRSAWLVITDSWDKGWRATVDGHRAAVLPADSAQRAIRVPAGSHVVRLDYEPTSLRLGEIVSLLTLGVLLAFLAFNTGYRSRTRRA